MERLVDQVPFLEKELFLLARIVRRGDVCIDVGASGGVHLVVMAVRVGPHGRVIGVEPRPGSLRLLRGLVRVTGVRRRVSLVQVALADGVGEEPMRIPFVPTRAHLPGTSRHRHAVAAFARLPARRVDVEVRTLDDLVDELALSRVDVLKCDVEGAELAVLAGGREVLRRHRPVVVAEADDVHQRRYDATAQDVVDAVTADGYATFRYARGRLDPVSDARPDEDDYVFVPLERFSPSTSRRTASRTSPTSSPRTTSARSS